MECCWDEFGPYVSVSFFPIEFIYLTFTIFLATIFVLKGIGTATNGAPSATNTSRPQYSSQVPIVNYFILFFFILLISISNYSCKIYLATTTISTRNVHRSITPPANQSAMTAFRSHRLGLLRSIFCGGLCDVPTLHHRPSRLERRQPTTQAEHTGPEHFQRDHSRSRTQS